MPTERGAASVSPASERLEELKTGSPLRTGSDAVDAESRSTLRR